MDRFIHRENIGLFRKRLLEPITDAERAIISKLLAEEEGAQRKQDEAQRKKAAKREKQKEKQRAAEAETAA